MILWSKFNKYGILGFVVCVVWGCEAPPAVEEQAPPALAPAPSAAAVEAPPRPALPHYEAARWSPGGEARWERVRPAHTAGQIEDVASVGEDALVATADGELWRVSQEGQWRRLGSWPEASLVKVAAWEDEAGAVVAALDDQGRVRLSLDGGEAWSVVLERPEAFGAPVARPQLQRHELPWHGLAARRVGGAVWLLVAGVGSRVAWSQDGGASWERWSGQSKEAQLSAAIGADGGLYTVGERGQGFARPAGEAWREIFQADKPQLWSVAVSPEGRRLVAVTAAGEVRRSEDGGATWEEAAALGGGLRAVRWESGERLWAAGERGDLWSSKDAGRRWERARRGDGRGLVGLGRGWAGGGAVLLRSARAGWEVVRGEAERDLRAVHVVDEGRGVAVGALGVVLRGQEGRWAEVEVGPRQDWEAVGFASGRFGWIGSAQGSVARTRDGGASWEVSALPDGEAGVLGVEALDARNVFAVGARGRAWSSQDGGERWSSLPLVAQEEGARGEAPALRAVTFEGAQERLRVLVGGERGGVWASSPQRRAYARSELSFLGGVAALERADGVLWLLDLSGLLLRRAEGEGAWQVVSVPAALEFSALAMSEAGQGVALTTSGLLLWSPDHGRQWWLSEHGAGRLLLGVASLGGGRFAAVGHGGEARWSEDGGRSWSAGEGTQGQSFNAVGLEGERLVAVGYQGAAAQSEDGGRRWAPWSGAPEGVGRHHLTALWFGPRGEAALGGVGALWVRPAGGPWRAVSVDGGGLGAVRQVAPDGEGGWWVVGEPGGLWRALPGEERLRPASLPGPSGAARWRGLWPQGEGRAVAALEEGLFAVSLRGEPGWSRLAAGGEAQAGGVAVTAGGVWRLGAGGLWGLGEGGWAQVLAPLPLRPVAIDFVNKDDGLAVTQGGGALLTGDGGRSWVVEATGTRTDLSGVSVSPSGEAWAVGRGGALLRRQARLSGVVRP